MASSNSILITGSNGQLGCELRERLSAGGFAEQMGWKIFYTDIAELDITDNGAVDTFIHNNKIDVVINCAAYTAVDRAEDERELCFSINGDAPGYIVDALKKNRNIRNGVTRIPLIIHISTDYIFDGSSSTPYDETSLANPQSVYGESKLAGERVIIGSGINYIIIRTSWLYSKYGKNFVETILELSAEREELNVVHDQRGTPSNAADLADAIVRMLSFNLSADSNAEQGNNLPFGVYHYSNEGICSWALFAIEIIRLAGRACKVNSVTTDEFAAKAKRPAYSVLDKSKIKSVYKIDIPDWRDSLARYLTTRHKK